MDNLDEDTIQLAQKLNNKLKIDHLDWHKLKGKKLNRSAELISAALCQLLISENEKDTIKYLEESLKWLKGINVDSPCPSKHSSF
ncbi:conserved hypothetical protein [Prochlorococcus marinus subsp. pastoris str. CCMP1986]|uniref:Uncharacterized protein n=1 Tax=Prochlorococcus marinus subsp. pastoris (strain CCMP1986 / NIES-2087 / MED4) TaxID=59919 RepID=Q7V1F1_PROMP|nr:DUF6439 family protein [Prochlorococcus marinus]KGF87513.1 hypothetical protein PROCH_0457 [Prochlorococcus marinus str. EQPAC1]CAE19381.1 conserved hypothetical protein [Prochlorococcus marinus subsp. pastoris str. CCMP1986]